MKNPRLTLRAVLLVAATLAIASCGEDNKATNVPTTPKELDSGDLAGGGTTYQNTFPTTIQTYPYRCERHPSMTGSVTVAAGAAMNVAVAISDFAFTPQNVNVGPGGTVTWTNNGTTHTVTSTN